MQIVIKGKNIEITDALKQYAEKKLKKMTKYFFDHVTEADVTFSVEYNKSMGKMQKVEVTVFADGVVIRGEESSQDMYSSIDLVVEKVKRQMRRYKEKLINRSRRQRNKLEPELKESAAGKQVDTEAVQPKIVRVKRFPVKPMSAEEAVLQMELVGHDFFVFTNANTERVNVLYRRKDGNYGLIEPEY